MKQNQVMSLVKGSISEAAIPVITINGRLPIVHLMELMRLPHVTVSPVYGHKMSTSVDPVNSDCKTPFTTRHCAEVADTATIDGEHRANKLRTLSDKPCPHFIQHVSGPAGQVFFTATSTMWTTVTSSLRRHSWSEMHWVADEITRVTSKAKLGKLEKGVWHCPYIFEDDLRNVFDFTSEALIASGVNTLNEDQLTERCFDTMLRLSVMRVINPFFLREKVEHSKNQIALDLQAFDALGDTRASFLIDAFGHQLYPDTIGEEDWLNPHLHGNTPGMCQFRYVHEWDEWRIRAFEPPAA